MKRPGPFEKEKAKINFESWASTLDLPQTSLTIPVECHNKGKKSIVKATVSTVRRTWIVTVSFLLRADFAHRDDREPPHFNPIQWRQFLRTATHYSALQHTATCHSTLQHTLQHTLQQDSKITVMVWSTV